MQGTEEAVERLLDSLEKVTPPEQWNDCLSILEKLISNIVSNPLQQKFRTIKTTNNAIKTRVLAVKGIEELIKLLGYRLEGDTYVISDENIGTLLTGAPHVDYHRRLIAAKLTSPEAYQKELAVIENQRAIANKRKKQAMEQERLRKQAEFDKQERKNMKVDNTQSKQLQFGTKATTWKDIGVDLCKKG